MTVKSLFDSYKLGGLTLKNRMVMNPMTRCRADEKAVPTAIMVQYYQERATAGLIVTEGIGPSANGKGYARIPGLWNQAQVEAWKPITAAVHGKGGHIFAQLMHCGRVSHPANMIEGGKIVAPSAVPLTGAQMYTDSAGMQDYPVPEVLDAKGIEAAKAEFVTAAKNAVAAGFDGIELHSANGYLLEQFLSPHTNTRTDNYGGSIENRIRFVVEVAQATAAAIGADKVGIRLSPYGVASGMSAYPEVEAEYLALLKALAALKAHQRSRMNSKRPCERHGPIPSSSEAASIKRAPRPPCRKDWLTSLASVAPSWPTRTWSSASKRDFR